MQKNEGHGGLRSCETSQESLYEEFRHSFPDDNAQAQFTFTGVHVPDLEAGEVHRNIAEAGHEPVNRTQGVQVPHGGLWNNIAIWQTAKCLLPCAVGKHLAPRLDFISPSISNAFRMEPCETI